MNMSHKCLIHSIQALIAMTVASWSVLEVDAQSYLINGVTYEAGEPSENLDVPSTSYQSAESSYEYSGYTLITASGWWNPYGLEINPNIVGWDCFYIFGIASGNTNYNLSPDLYWGTAPVNPSSPTAISPYNDVYPPYTTSHTYTFIANTGTSSPSHLYFGVGDSTYWDNTGSITLTIAQLAPVLSAPEFTIQPVSQVIDASQTVTFSCAVTGYPAPSLRWQFNGTNVVNATNLSYSISSTGLTNLGLYDVVAFNSIGTNVSATVSLSFLAIKCIPSLIINGPVGETYAIQASPSLQGTNWVTITNITLTSTQPYFFTDYAATNQVMFYRAVPTP